MDSHRIERAQGSILQHPAVEGIRSVLTQTSSPPVYLVGGALRDAWLGLEIRDFDFVVPGEARIVARQLARALEARYVLLDEDWGVARLIWRACASKEDFTWLDFASMRGSRIQEDLWQRDFTCNAMAMPIVGGREAEGFPWEDPTGGLRDLRARTVRMVHPARLREDPLRLLRAFRLACSLALQIEAFTLETIRAERAGLLSVAAERVRDELYKILACPGSLPWLLGMEETGLLASIFPELLGLKGLQQGDYHHLDAWEHTLEAYRILEGVCQHGWEPAVPQHGELKEWIDSQRSILPLLKMAVLFHDAGKPGTGTTGEVREPHFYGHATTGAEIVSETMRRLRTSRHDEERVTKWVRYHMGPVHMLRALEEGHLTEKAKIRFLRRLGADAPGMLLVALADFEASRGPAATADRRVSFYGLLDSLTRLYFERDAASVSTKRLVTGKDLIDALGIPPGPTVGRLLNLLEEARVEGRVSNRSEALLLARSLLEGLR
jgi:poly(A) polymerase